MKEKVKRDAKKTKEKIVQNAVKLFCSKGYSGTSVDEIASASNINKAMIYYYYKSKSLLYEEVVSTLMEDIYTQVLTAYDKSENSPDLCLQAFIVTYTGYAFKHPYFPALLLGELSDSGAHLPEKIFEKMRKIFKLLTKILIEGEEAGIFYDVKPMMIHFMIIGTINLMVTTQSLRQKVIHFEDEQLNVCLECTQEDVSSYIFKKVLKMLKD